ncbi:MAG: DUF4214 domain-containing protein [Candidatus Competibacteraceae bacterium]|nr:DUF4214 domain-containing protein [Candidatus Competibacteraceae bacterium]MCP5124849.1 DUF4214 domain-containing protein [Gammaproteobacteria bacterium]
MKFRYLVTCFAASSGLILTSFAEVNLKDTRLVNKAAYIPSQCYTATIDSHGRVHNPCYTCHTQAVRPNQINDSDLQLSYSFPASSTHNYWQNLFVDHTLRVAAINDQDILNYIRQDNYLGDDGEPILAHQLSNLPEAWDYNSDGVWSGFIPDAYFHFDSEGFDQAPDGRYTGWRAFAYYPFPGTFWPTNGSTDDVLIRLAEPFRADIAGQFDLTVYKINLAILEALFTEQDVTIDPVDENRFGVDLDKNGQLATATRITYDWAPLEGRNMSYVGQAGVFQQQGQLHLAARLFPEGTEFLHSVRYIDLDENGNIRLAPRLKELRYGRKAFWLTYASLRALALNEEKENHDFPDRLRQIIGDPERGIANGQGWVYQGFIEDASGQLRPQTHEENVFCIGCHSGIGVTSDGIFSFARKLAADQAYARGWYHWSQKSLQGLPEPKVKLADGTTQYEYSFYLQQNPTGNEFLINNEVLQRFFNADGSIKPDQLSALHEDITLLINPSPERALELNKAYKTIVEDQNFIQGRDPNVAPATSSVYADVEQDQSTGIVSPISTLGINNDPVAILITHYYVSILERAPDAAGLAYWQNQIVQNQEQGIDVKPVFQEMAISFFNSPEYLGRNTTNEQFIADVYLTFFQRDPDEAGLTFWLEALTRGVTRNEVIISFLFSPEFTEFMQALGL